MDCVNYGGKNSVEEQERSVFCFEELPRQIKHQNIHNPQKCMNTYCYRLNCVPSKKICGGASLVAQWLRIRLPVQGTWVRALVREDPTCRGATKPVHHSYWACALEPVSHNYWAHVLQLLKPAHLEPVLCNKRSHCNEKPAPQRRVAPRSPQLEKAHVQQRRPNAAKSK